MRDATLGAGTMSVSDLRNVRYLRSSSSGKPAVPRVTAPVGDVVSNT